MPQYLSKGKGCKLNLDEAESIQDLRDRPANHLEKVGGDQTGQDNIRIN